MTWLWTACLRIWPTRTPHHLSIAVCIAEMMRQFVGLLQTTRTTICSCSTRVRHLSMDLLKFSVLECSQTAWVKSKVFHMSRSLWAQLLWNNSRPKAIWFRTSLTSWALKGENDVSLQSRNCPPPFLCRMTSFPQLNLCSFLAKILAVSSLWKWRRKRSSCAQLSSHKSTLRLKRSPFASAKSLRMSQRMLNSFLRSMRQIWERKRNKDSTLERHHVR